MGFDNLRNNKKTLFVYGFHCVACYKVLFASNRNYLLIDLRPSNTFYEKTPPLYLATLRKNILREDISSEVFCELSCRVNIMADFSGNRFFKKESNHLVLGVY